jgi:putative NIF3 family GTP cyclohydrolase 1 type 2
VDAPITAHEVVSRIRDALPVQVHDDTVDVFLEGDPDLSITGIAVTMMATFEVLENAVAAGANMVITHEPLYFNHQNEFAPKFASAADPIFLAKRDFLAEHQVTVWHCHDLLHQVQPDMIHLGVLTALGWPTAGIKAGYPSMTEIPAATLADVLQHVAERLAATSLRYVGDPGQRVQRIAIGCGYAGLEGLRPTLCRDDLDLVLVGESWEWEFGEYAYDSAFLSSHSARPKAFAVIGHVPSEQQGMAFFSKRLREFLPEVPVHFVPATDIYRSL